ncbi:MAG: hypothetical protein C4530_21655 [Desulfobacteraceae bacterium]|nr:MAG: hypothetical protein C4530_21655 [Desulfobacteraceae bacterium]
MDSLKIRQSNRAIIHQLRIHSPVALEKETRVHYFETVMPLPWPIGRFQSGATRFRTVSALAFLFVLLLLSSAAKAPAKESAADRFSDLPFTFLANERPVYVIVVEKDHQRLQVLKRDKDWQMVAQYPCATGENAGKKEASGDSRTPEGIYFITEYFKDSKITVFGNRAFHIDYPNVFDVSEGRNGDGIYIHGTNRTLVPKSTNGCITMDNRDLDEITRYLHIDATPIVITPSIDHLRLSGAAAPAEVSQMKSLLLPDEADIEQVDFDSLYLLRNEHQMVAVGELTYQTADSGAKRSYSRIYLDPSSSAVKNKIVRNELERGEPARIEPIELATVSKGTLYPRDEKAVLALVEKWRKAWSAKDINTYIKCYREDFVSGKMNRAAWRAYKERLNAKYGFINVAISDVSVSWTGAGASVSFVQRYASDQYQARGRKVLLLRYGAEDWRIYRELWISGAAS